MDSPLQVAALPEATPISLTFGAGPLVEYCGARTIATFDGEPQETAALLTIGGVFDLGWKARIRVAGADRTRWLNGMVTNSVQSLQPGESNYNFVLSAQGRIQGDLRAFCLPDSFVLETTRDQRDTLLAWLDKYIIMDDVELSPDDALTSIGIAGPRTLELLHQAGVPAGEIPPAGFKILDWQHDRLTVIHAESSLSPRYELWGAPELLASLWQALTGAGARPCGSSAIERLRILSGAPRFGVDITTRDLPQETNQLHALHFTKGCYLGQEIVERIRSRGAVHRGFGGFLLQGAVPAAGTALSIDGKNVGELTSITTAMDGQPVGLGYARRELVERSSTFDYPGGTAHPATLPFRVSLE